MTSLFLFYYHTSIEGNIHNHGRNGFASGPGSKANEVKKRGQMLTLTTPHVSNIFIYLHQILKNVYIQGGGGIITSFFGEVVAGILGLTFLSL